MNSKEYEKARMTIRIRTATPADAEVITEFNTRLAKETEDRVLNPARLHAGVKMALSDVAKGQYFVAERDGEVVGQVLLTYEWSDWRNGNFWWLQSVYVKRAFRGQGVCKALFEHVRSLAAERSDVCGLRLYVEAENAPAKLAYERLGMRSTPYEVLELEFERLGE